MINREVVLVYLFQYESTVSLIGRSETVQLSLYSNEALVL